MSYAVGSGVGRPVNCNITGTEPTAVRWLFGVDTVLRLSFGVDLKRGGIFPIVQGIRTMALQYQIAANNTFLRIDALVEMGVIPQRMGGELQEAFSVFHWLRVKAELARQAKAQDSPALQNMIDLNDLDRLEKDTLRQAFHVVKEFKKHLTLRYQLGGGL